MPGKGDYDELALKELISYNWERNVSTLHNSFGQKNKDVWEKTEQD